ncbi:MAG: molybdopterin-dependent oxidoreductase [Ilumatobacteraceae bacterium]
MTTASFMERKRDELSQRGIDPARLPPGQYVTERFPVLHIGPTPADVTPAGWQLDIGGDAIDRPTTISWQALHEMPSTELTVDIHCVTKWSKLDVRWRGVLLADVLHASGPSADATTLVARGEHGYTASMSYRELLDNVCLVAYEVDGEPLAAEHGAPVRLVVPHLYFWKSVKWLRGIELCHDPARIGFWERNGYHEHGDPFREQRYWGDDPS